jgi:ferrochelatase
LGYLAWAGCGKDPGFSPSGILAHAGRSSRYTDVELASLEFEGAPPTAADLSRRWHTMLDEARELVRLLPAEHAGRCVLMSDLTLFRGDGAALEQTLRGAGLDIRPDIAMRYWRPFPDQTVASLLKQGATQFLVVPMYPQFSAATNGSTLDYVLDSLRRLAPSAPVHAVADWHLLPGFLESLARPAAAQLGEWAAAGSSAAESALLYVAHSLPYSFIKRGDCYEERTLETVAAVHARVTAALAAAGHASWQSQLMVGGKQPMVAFQSRVGPIKWLEPNIEAETRRLAAAGCRRLFVQPVSFTCEHIETLLELDLELKETAEKAGLHGFARGAALNEDAVWLDSLAGHLAATAFGRGNHSA